MVISSPPAWSEKNPKAKVIIITAYPTIETAVEAMRGGAIDYLPKPFELNRLETSFRQSYLAEAVTAPPVEAPIVEEKFITPCIWTQAGIVQKRTCTFGYQCNTGCDFHAGMMKKEKYRNDARIKPFIDKLNSLLGRTQCRYTMSGELSARSCSSLFYCEKCEFHQMIQDKIDHHLVMKAAQRKRIEPADTEVLIPKEIFRRRAITQTREDLEAEGRLLKKEREEIEKRLEELERQLKNEEKVKVF